MNASEPSMKVDFVKIPLKTILLKGAARLDTSSGIEIINEL